MEGRIDFGELSHDEDLKERILTFHENLNKVEKMLEEFCSMNIYNKLSPQDKVRYDLFQAFAINSLYWFYLRTKGIDPNQHDIRSEINRIRDFMVKSQKLYDKQNLMPRIDQDAAKRFIKSGLWQPNHQLVDDTSNKEENPNFKKRKREHDDSDEDDN